MPETDCKSETMFQKLKRDLEKPDGWKWFETPDGRRFFNAQSPDGSMLAIISIICYDPEDRALAESGDFNGAYQRGTAKRFDFNLGQMDEARGAA